MVANAVSGRAAMNGLSVNGQNCEVTDAAARAVGQKSKNKTTT